MRDWDKNAIAKSDVFDLSLGKCLMAQNKGEGLTNDL